MGWCALLRLSCLPILLKCVCRYTFSCTCARACARTRMCVRVRLRVCVRMRMRAQDIMSIAPIIIRELGQEVAVQCANNLHPWLVDRVRDPVTRSTVKTVATALTAFVPRALNEGTPHRAALHSRSRLCPLLAPAAAAAPLSSAARTDRRRDGRTEVTKRGAVHRRAVPYSAFQCLAAWAISLSRSRDS